MHAKSETEILEPEVVDEEENTKEWEQEEQEQAEILEVRVKKSEIPLRY